MGRGEGCPINGWPGMQTRILLSYFFAFYWLSVLGEGQAAPSVHIQVHASAGKDGIGCGQGTATACRSIAFAVNSIPLGGAGIITLSTGTHVIEAQPGAEVCTEACFTATADLTACSSCPIGISLSGRHISIRSTRGAPDMLTTVVDCSRSKRCFKSHCPSGSANATCTRTSSVTLEGITLSGASMLSLGGGGVQVDGPALVMRHVTVVNSSAARGGGVHVVSSAYQVVLDHVTFDLCSASNDSYSEVQDRRGRGGGAFVANAPSLLISDSLFTNCIADEAGCLSLQSVNTTILRSTLQDSAAVWQAAGMKVDFFQPASALYVTNCTFQNLHTGEPMGGEQAGAIAWGGVVSYWTDVYAFNNTNIGPYGGGFYWSLPSSPTAMTRSYFLRTVVRGCSAKYGGAFMFYAGGAEFRDCLIDSCSASYQAGGMYILLRADNMLLINTNITNCVSNTEGGAISTYTNNITIQGGHWSNNSAVQSGGCLYAVPTSSASQITIDGVTMTNCHTYQEGGAIYQYGGTSAPYITTTTIKNSIIQDSQSISGGCLYAVNGEVNIQNTTFRNCKADVEGGALYIVDNTRTVISNSTFQNSQARRAGAMAVEEGASVFERYNTEIADSLFVDNAAIGGDGAGALYCGDNSFSFMLSNVTFRNNSALASGAEGGAVVMKGTNMTILGSTFANNSADSFGGALVLTSTAIVKAIDCSFDGNMAKLGGGAVYASTSAHFTGLRSNFSGNSGGRGGALLVQVDAIVRLASSRLQDNAASSFGGAAAMMDRSSIMTEGSSFSDNLATSGGGGLYSSDSGRIFSFTSHFLSNSAKGPGGAIYCSQTGLYLNVSRATFVSNSGTSGGAVYVAANASGAIRDSLFDTNQVNATGSPPVGGDGGGLQVVALKTLPQLVLRNLTFSGNVAARGGAIFQAYNVEDPLFLNCQSCKNLNGNTANYGKFQATAAVTFDVRADNSPVSVERFLVTSGLSAPPFVAVLQDHFGNTVTTDTSDLAEIISPHLFGTLRVVIDKGVFHWQNVFPVSTGIDRPAATGANFQANIAVTSLTGTFPGTLTKNITFQFCPGGTYVSSNSSACLICPVGYFCPAAEQRQKCPDDYFSFAEGASSLEDCISCGTGLVCQDAVLNVSLRHWTNLAKLAGDPNPMAYQCNLRGCQGASYNLSLPANDSSQCAIGYRNSRLCNRCDHNYYYILGGCTKCSDLYKHLWYLLAVLVVVAWVLLNIVASNVQSINVLLVEMQFITVMGQFNLNWWYGWISTCMKFFQVSLFNVDFLGPECIRGSYTYNNRWVFGACLPLVGIGIYGVYFLYGEFRSILRVHFPKLRYGHNVPSRQLRLSRILSGMSNLLDILYFDLTIRCFEIFQAVEYDAKVLVSDPTVLWHSATHNRLIPFAILYTIVYVIGFPLVATCVLFWGERKGIMHEEYFRQTFGWMYDSCETGYWWLGLPVIYVRRILFAAILVFLYTSPDLQSVLILIVLVLTICLHYLFKPMRQSFLNVLAGLLYLGQFSFLLGGIGSNYMTSSVSGTVASSLGGAAVLTFILSACIVIPYELHGYWAESWVRRWARTYSEPANALSKSTSLRLAAAPFIFKSHRETLERSASLRPEVDGHLVPLEEITSWFTPRIMNVFLRYASPEELACLHAVRYHYSYHKPSHADFKATCAIFVDFSKEMRFAAISQLLQDDHSDTIYADGSLFHQGSGKEGSSGIDMTADVDPGQRRLVRLRSVAAQMVKERSKSGDSLRVLFQSHHFQLIAAWLIFGSAECRRVFKDFVEVLRRRLLSMPLAPKVLEDGEATKAPQEEEAEQSLHDKLRSMIFRHWS